MEGVGDFSRTPSGYAITKGREDAPEESRGGATPNQHRHLCVLRRRRF